MGEPKTVGGYYFKDWDKPYGKDAKSACGGASALGAAQAWAKKQGRSVPTGINSKGDTKALIDNCKAYEKDQKKDKDKDKGKDKGKDKKDDLITVSDQPQIVGTNADGQGLTQAEYDLYSAQTMGSLQHGFNMELQDSINASSLAVQNLANEALAYAEDAATGRNVYSEDAASWRTQYSYDAQERWNKYDSAMDYKALTDSERIRGEYANDLAEIMRAGNESVAKIQGEYSNANTMLTGEYNLAGEKIRGAAARDVAQRNKEASMFGSFLGGFWS